MGDYFTFLHYASLQHGTGVARRVQQPLQPVCARRMGTDPHIAGPELSLARIPRQRQGSILLPGNFRFRKWFDCTCRIYLHRLQHNGITQLQVHQIFDTFGRRL